jgi:PAS domain S-box-containing protein
LPYLLGPLRVPVLGAGSLHGNRSAFFYPRTPVRSGCFAVGKMDRHRSKSSKHRAPRPAKSRLIDINSLSEPRPDKKFSKSGLAFPQREPRSSRGDPLHPFVALVKTFNEFLFELDADGKFLSIWTSNEALLRERRSEFLGRRALEVLGEEIFHPFSKLFRRVIKQGACEDIEFPVDFPAGRRWFQARVSAVGRGAKKPDSVCLLARDITQRRLAEEALRQQEALLMHAEQVTGTGCSEYDLGAGQRIWSRQLFRIFGFDPKDGVPSLETMFAMIHPDDRERIRGILQSAIDRCSSFESEGRYNLPDGRQRNISVRGITLSDESGKTARLLSVVQDVTEIRLAEAQDRQRESLLAQAEQLASLGSWEFDVAQQSFAWSAQMYRMLGLSPENQPVPLSRACAMFHPEDRARVTQEVADLVQYTRPLENEVRFVLPDGQVRIFHSRAIPITNDSGDVVRIAGMSQDITEQKLSQDRLRKSESLLAQAEEIAQLGSWEMDTVHSTFTCSAEFFRMLGLEPQAGPIPAEDMWSMVRLEDLGGAQHALQTAISTNTPLEHFSRVTMPDGRMRVLHTRAIPLADASGQVTRFVGCNHDITEQKRVEDDLRRLSRQLLTLRSEEQRRLARELHETASQTLTALKMTLKQIDDLLPPQDLRARELIKSSRTLASDAMREVRTISSILHPPLMDEAGLTAGLRSYVRLFSERSGVAVNFTFPEDFQRLPKEVELTLFCVAQESLANVHRHSKARTVDISVERTPSHVSLTVRDDGVGMPAALHSDRRNSLLGIGIAGMRERVGQLQGDFRIHTSPGNGTTILVILPVVGGEQPE